MDTEAQRTAQAKAVVQDVLDTHCEGIPYRLGLAWEINSSHLTFLLRDDNLTNHLDDLLVSKGMLEKKPPIDPRPRVWMRTDDVDKAVCQLLKHYTVTQIAEALVRNDEDIDNVTIEQYLTPKYPETMRSIWD